MNLRKQTIDDVKLRGKRVAIPGRHTTAFLLNMSVSPRFSGPVIMAR